MRPGAFHINRFVVEKIVHGPCFLNTSGLSDILPLGLSWAGHWAAVPVQRLDSPGTDPASVSAAVLGVGGALHMDYRLEWEREVTVYVQTIPFLTQKSNLKALILHYIIETLNKIL